MKQISDGNTGAAGKPEKEVMIASLKDLMGRRSQ
jgi:hypothetical protein